MNRKRHKHRRPKSPILPAPIAPQTETISIIKELNDSFLSSDKGLSLPNRKAFERALHDQIGKTVLHLSAIAIHKQARQARLLSISDFIINFVSDPVYLKQALRDPETATKLLKLMHDMEKQDSEFLLELAVGKKEKEIGGFDQKKILSLVLGLAGASPANLPPELQDPSKLRKFRLLAQSLVDFMEGDDVPKPPSRPERVINQSPEKDGLDGD